MGLLALYVLSIYTPLPSYYQLHASRKTKALFPVISGEKYLNYDTMDAEGIEIAFR